MGIASPGLRLLSITAYKSNLEYRITTLSQRRQRLSFQAGQMASSMGNMYMNSTQGNSRSYGMASRMAASEQQQKMINEMDKRLELEQKNLETQHKAVTAEYESVQKLLDNNIKREFKLFA